MGQNFRTREHHVLIDEDGRPKLIYDLERTQIFPVAGALEQQLIDHNVVTATPRPAPFVAETPLEVDDVALDIAGACNMGCKYCFETDIGARQGPMSASTVDATIGLIFAKAAPTGVIVQFVSGESLTNFPLLAEVVAKAENRARCAGVPVSFALTTNATLVTQEVSAFLADHGFRVKVSLDGPKEIHDGNRPMLGGRPSYERVVRGVLLLADHLPRSALTVNSVVRPETPLGELWDWVQAFPVGNWVTIQASGRFAHASAAQIEARQRDLARISDDIARALEGGDEIIEYEPLLKVVRKLAAPAPAVRYCGAAGSFIGVRSDGGVYPCLRQLGVEEHRIGDVRTGLDEAKRREYRMDFATPVDHRSICKACWARYLCGGGCYADSIVYGDNPASPLVSHCAFFRLEIEAGIRLFDRLRTRAPLAVIDLFGAEIRSAFDDGVAELTR